MGPSEKIGRRLRNQDDHDGVQKNMMGRELIRGWKIVGTRENIFHTCGNS
jgi:hypothetical protein